MKILVTGGAGFIGTNLIKRLLSEGHEVHSMDNYDSGLESNHQPNCNYITADIETIEYFEGNGFELVYHLAALSRIQPSFENPTETFRVNVRGSEAVANWAKHNNVKVVYAGSSSKWHDPTISPYAMYKYLGEEVFKLYRKTFDVNVEICRFYNVYGPGESLDEKNGNVIGIWRSKIEKDPEWAILQIVGDGEQRRDFTHVDDIVDGLMKISETEDIHEDAWELGTGVNYSINELSDMFTEKYPSIQFEYIQEQKGNYRETLNTNTDAIDRLGWKPQDRLEDYIKSL